MSNLPNTPLQPGYLPGNGPESTDMLIQFSDGEKVLPAWMVTHIGGNVEVEKVRSELASLIHAEFIKDFFDGVSSNYLSGLQRGIVANHIGRLKSQQRFKLGR